MSEPARRPRWDPDERGIGVADARGHVAVIDALRAAATEDGWVAEAPEDHLLPHIRGATGAGVPLAVGATRTTPDGTFEVDLHWTGEPEPGQATLRAAAFALIGTVAEASTVVHELRGTDDEAVFEVMTGLLPDDTHFATHGHTLRLRVRVDA